MLHFNVLIGLWFSVFHTGCRHLPARDRLQRSGIRLPRADWESRGEGVGWWHQVELPAEWQDRGESGPVKWMGSCSENSKIAVYVRVFISVTRILLVLNSLSILEFRLTTQRLASRVVITVPRPRGVHKISFFFLTSSWSWNFDILVSGFKNVIVSVLRNHYLKSFGFETFSGRFFFYCLGRRIF